MYIFFIALAIWATNQDELKRQLNQQFTGLQKAFKQS